MKKLNIDSIIYYGRSYGEYDEPCFFLDLDGLEILERDKLILEYNLTSEILSDIELLRENYRFIPVFRVNIIDEMRKFLNALNNRKIIQKIAGMQPDRLYIYFQIHIELNYGDNERWGEYEEQILTKAAVSWCKENHIPYFLNE